MDILRRSQLEVDLLEDFAFDPARDACGIH